MPTFKIGARGLLRQQLHIQAATEVTAWRREYREQRAARLEDKPAEFPYGTYQLRREHNVAVAEPDFSALVAAPGPTLQDVLDEFREKPELRESQDLRESRNAVIDEVRGAWRDEAEDVAEGLELRLEGQQSRRKVLVAGGRPSAGDNESPTDEAPASPESPRPEVHVRHRFTPRGDGQERTRRLIILRDRRRGRPPKPEPPDTDPQV